MNAHNRTAVLCGAALIGAVSAVLINVLSGRMFFGFDNTLGALGGGLIGMGAGAAIVLGNHQFRLFNSLTVAFAWCFLTHLLNVTLGWTSHGLTITSTFVSVVMAVAVGTAAWVCGYMNRRQENPESGVERGIVLFALGPVCAATVLAANFYDDFVLFGHQPNSMLAAGAALGVLAWASVILPRWQRLVGVMLGGLWMLANYTLVVMLVVGPDYLPENAATSVALGCSFGICNALFAAIFPTTVPTFVKSTDGPRPPDAW